MLLSKHNLIALIVNLIQLFFKVKSMAEVSGDTKIYRRIKKDLRESLGAVDSYLDTGFANKSTSNVS